MEYQNIVNPCIRDCDIMNSTPCGMDFSACPPDFIPRKTTQNYPLTWLPSLIIKKLNSFRKLFSEVLLEFESMTPEMNTDLFKREERNRETGKRRGEKVKMFLNRKYYLKD